MSDLHGTRAKLQRAKDQLEDLCSRFERFVQSKPYTITQENDLHAGERVIVYRSTERLPLAWSVILGELVYDLRSALDHLVYVPSQTTRSEFPIFDDRDRFFERERNGKPSQRSGLFKMRGLNEKAQAVIEALQPFNIRKPGKEAVLYMLSELCNIDKHRTLHLCRVQNRKLRWRALRDVSLSSIDMTLPGRLEERTDLMRWKPVVLDDEVDMEVEIAPEIAFDEGPVPAVHDRPVVTVCEALIVGVERVIGFVEPTLT